MTKAYRDNTDSLQAENERLRAEIATLKTKPATAWGIRTDMDDAPFGALAILALVLLIGIVTTAAWWVLCGWGTEGGLRAGRFIAAWSGFALAWVLAFIRRVPK